MRYYDDENRTNTAPEDGNSLSALLNRCGRFTAHYVEGTRGQSGIIKILSEVGEITQSELREKLGVQPGSLSEVLTRMEARGLITRTRDEEDRRKATISLTEEGKKRSEAFNGGEQNDIFSALTPEEQAALTELLTKLDDSWTPIINERRSRTEDGAERGGRMGGRHGEGRGRGDDDRRHGDGERRGRGDDDRRHGDGEYRGRGDDERRHGDGERRGRGDDDRRHNDGERRGRGDDDRRHSDGERREHEGGSRSEHPRKGDFKGHNRDEHPGRGGRRYED